MRWTMLVIPSDYFLDHCPDIRAGGRSAQETVPVASGKVVIHRPEYVRPQSGGRDGGFDLPGAKGLAARHVAVQAARLNRCVGRIDAVSRFEGFHELNRDIAVVPGLEPFDQALAPLRAGTYILLTLRQNHGQAV